MDPSTRSNPEAVVTENTARSRFEISLDGETVGWADYAPIEGGLAITHTEIDPRFGRRGLGVRLLHDAFVQLRDSGRQIVPACSFAVKYVARNPGWMELVVPAWRERIRDR